MHPLVTLLEKLDALSRRYRRDVIEPDGFARHYEDAARIIRSLGELPAVDQPARVLAEELLADRDIAAVPRDDEPALVLADAGRRAAVERALERIAPMFWGARIPLDEASDTIRAWVRRNLA